MRKKELEEPGEASAEEKLAGPELKEAKRPRSTFASPLS